MSGVEWAWIVAAVLWVAAGVITVCKWTGRWP